MSPPLVRKAVPVSGSIRALHLEVLTTFLPRKSRRDFLGSAAFAVAAGATRKLWLSTANEPTAEALLEFGYGQVSLSSDQHEDQLRQTHSVLMELSEDSLLKPIRAMAGQPAPGAEMGGWYLYNPDYDLKKGSAGFAPGAAFGQWVSALARYYAITGDTATREKVLRLNKLYAQTISGDFYAKNRFPAYCYDKIVCGLIESYQYVGDQDAFAIMDRTTEAALPHLPGQAIEHGTSWRPGTDESYTWDESYTISENLFLAYQRGAGARYRDLAIQYLDSAYYGPLAEGKNDLAGRHAYSYVNSLSSAMQAYLTIGSEKHFQAAKNGFDMLAAQSFVTGGWGPDEMLRAPDSPDVLASLTNTHSSFETPCGAYAHFKLTRYLLRVTRDPRYGDSMERMMYNTILGAKPLKADGRAFYYSDYNFEGHKVYSPNRWPCCSGTFPQVAADYRINTYFRDAQSVYVNLYIPSTLKCEMGGAQMTLLQQSLYPAENVVRFDVTVSRPAEFALRLRIPAWANGASISVSGKRGTIAAAAGSFAVLQRKWKTGDRVELELPSNPRLEAVDPSHPEVVALLSGPRVLFAITKTAPTVSRRQLLAARSLGSDRWQVDTSKGAMTMLPFTAIDEDQYSTYLKVV
jgi:uncharacterized protein